MQTAADLSAAKPVELSRRGGRVRILSIVHIEASSGAVESTAACLDVLSSDPQENAIDEAAVARRRLGEVPFRINFGPRVEQQNRQPSFGELLGGETARRASSDYDRV